MEREVDGSVQRVQLWDPIFIEEGMTNVCFVTILGSLHQLGPIYTRNTDGVLLCMDLSRKRDSFENNLKFWTQWIAENQDLRDKPVLVLGTKCDLPLKTSSHLVRQVTLEQAEKASNELSLPYIETSSKDSINTEEALLQILRMVLSSNT